MPAFWNPREVLGVNPAESHFTCTAIVIPKKKRGQPREPPRRCLQSFLSNECKDQACRILDTLAHVDIVLVGVSEGINRALVHVAERTACPRLHKEPHRSQAEAVGSKWTDLVGQFIVRERASRRRAEREGLRSLAVAEPRAASHNPSHLNRVPSAPNIEDPGMRQAPERAARRPRENRQQAPEVPPQYRPRDRQQEQVLLQGQNAGRGDIHEPRQVQVNPVQQQPVQDLDPRMAHQVVRREDALLEALPVRRRNTRPQAEAEPAPNQDQLVDRIRAYRPYLAQPAPVPHAGVEHRAEPGPMSLSPTGVLARRPARALPDRLPLEVVAGPANGGEVDDLRLLVHQLDLLREQADQGEVEPFGRADDVVWCQGQCGHNVHRECSETWQLHSEYVGRKCGYCRAPWVEN
ncbi:hypothetical protein IFR04_007625 [Cadophora malorum]|uniref:RING-type domain-containing protein n=1 Tax=Cadophora malorum TaxID=108018 RepID=A0A8H7TI42_9HELO|nr:hypothetical protein IFR04_007625 [Cadophora malorum]